MKPNRKLHSAGGISGKVGKVQPMRFSPAQHGLTLPKVGQLWKNVSTGVVYESLGGVPILIREVSKPESEPMIFSEPIKILDAVDFYRDFSYQGRVK
jgi:hypothetical protein